MSRRHSFAGRDGTSALLSDVYARLGTAYGGEHWHWMPEHASPIEIIVGAILVQHTNWRNAERALHAMRAAGLLDAASILNASDQTIEGAIRSSGTATVKARRLRAVAQTIVDAGGLDALLALPPDAMRLRLLGTHGIGPETADAIALYAAGRRVFVIDAYTKRVFRRLGALPPIDGYEGWRAFFEQALTEMDAAGFQRYHAWTVLHAKCVCRAVPLCPGCPLLAICNTG